MEANWFVLQSGRFAQEVEVRHRTAASRLVTAHCEDAGSWRIDARLMGNEDPLTLATETTVAMVEAYRTLLGTEPAEAAVEAWQESFESFWEKRLSA